MRKHRDLQSDAFFCESTLKLFYAAAFTSISLNDEEEDNDDDGPRQVVGLKWPLVSAGLNPATRRFPS